MWICMQTYLLAPGHLYLPKRHIDVRLMQDLQEDALDVLNELADVTQDQESGCQSSSLPELLSMSDTSAEAPDSLGNLEVSRAFI